MLFRHAPPHMTSQLPPVSRSFCCKIVITPEASYGEVFFDSSHGEVFLTNQKKNTPSKNFRKNISTPPPLSLISQVTKHVTYGIVFNEHPTYMKLCNLRNKQHASD